MESIRVFLLLTKLSVKSTLEFRNYTKIVFKNLFLKILYNNWKNSNALQYINSCSKILVHSPRMRAWELAFFTLASIFYSLPVKFFSIAKLFRIFLILFYFFDFKIFGLKPTMAGPQALGAILSGHAAVWSIRKRLNK